MKIKITDVQKVIREIIAEENPSYERVFKYPSLEDQTRIQREFNIRINFENCIKHPHAEDFFKSWCSIPGSDFDLPKPLKYYIVGLVVKEVHSTIDDGHALLLASLCFESPFGKPHRYSAVAYGPKELMKQIMLTIKSEMYSTITDFMGNLTQFTDRYLRNMGIYSHIGEMFYKKLDRFAKEGGIPHTLGPHNTRDNMTITFKNLIHVQSLAERSVMELRKIITTEFPEISFRLEFYKDKLTMSFFNKYTGYTLGEMVFNNVNIKYDHSMYSRI